MMRNSNPSTTRRRWRPSPLVTTPPAPDCQVDNDNKDNNDDDSQDKGNNNTSSSVVADSRAAVDLAAADRARRYHRRAQRFEDRRRLLRAIHWNKKTLQVLEYDPDNVSPLAASCLESLVRECSRVGKREKARAYRQKLEEYHELQCMMT